MRKNLRNILLVLGILLIVAGIVLMAVIVPSMRVMPDDVNTTRTYDVSYLIMLDPATMTLAIVSPDTIAALPAEARPRLERNISVEEVDGNQTLVRETQTMYAGETPRVVIKRYTLDRGSLLTVANPPTEWTTGEGFLPERTGMMIGWGPEGIEQRDYAGWSDDYGLTVPMVFVAEGGCNSLNGEGCQPLAWDAPTCTIATTAAPTCSTPNCQDEWIDYGVDTYHFVSWGEPAPITPENVARLGLPAELTFEQLQQLVSGLTIEDPIKRMFVTTLLPNLLRQAVIDTGVAEPTAVPLAYYYDYVGEYWAEPTTGMLIDTRKCENRTVTFAPEVMANLATALTQMGQDPAALSELLPMTVSKFEYAASAQSVQDATDEAKDNLDKLNLFGKTIPMVLIALGVVAFLVGWYVHFTTAKAAPAPAATKPEPKKEEPKP